MVKIFVSPYCQSCRKAQRFLDHMMVPHQVINIFSKDLKKEDLLEILKLSENGTDDIISPRSKVYKSGGVDLESMTLNQLLDFVLANPTIMKRPIIIDDRKMEVGYDPDEITAFLPKATKKLLEMCADCPMTADCNLGKALIEARNAIEADRGKGASVCVGKDVACNKKRGA